MLTGRMINNLLKSYLEEKAVYLGGKISSHSFRAGLVTAMARAGCDEAVIKQMGRWKSEAYYNEAAHLLIMIVQKDVGMYCRLSVQ